MINFKKDFIILVATLILFTSLSSAQSDYWKDKLVRQWQPFGSSDGSVENTNVVAIESGPMSSVVGGYGAPQPQPEPQPEPQVHPAGGDGVVPTPQENLITGIQFDCSKKPTGPNRDPQYCDIFHACVYGKQQKTYSCPQVGDRFYYDEMTQKCELSSKSYGCPSNKYYQPISVPPTQQPQPTEPPKPSQPSYGQQQQQYPAPQPQPQPMPSYQQPQQPKPQPTLPPQPKPTQPQYHPPAPQPGYGNMGNTVDMNSVINMDEPWKLFVRQNEQFACDGKADGYYPSNWCNVFYRCFGGRKFEFLCAKQTNGDRLWWNQHSTSQVLPQETAQCGFPCTINRPCSSPGGILKDDSMPVSSSQTDGSRILASCPAPGGSPNSMIMNNAYGGGFSGTGTGTGTGQQGILEDNSNDLFRLPDGDPNICRGQPEAAFIPSQYCNVFHRCIAGTRKDFLCAKATNTYELWWNDATKLCDYPCRVQCTKPIFGGQSSAGQISMMDSSRNCPTSPRPVQPIYPVHPTQPIFPVHPTQPIFPTQPSFKPTQPVYPTQPQYFQTHPPQTQPSRPIQTHPPQTQPPKPIQTYPPQTQPPRPIQTHPPQTQPPKPIQTYPPQTQPPRPIPTHPPQQYNYGNQPTMNNNMFGGYGK